MMEHGREASTAAKRARPRSEHGREAARRLS
jgi:hypothetical protein